MTTYHNLDDVPSEHYGLLASDIPSKFMTRSPKGITSRSPDHHYETMTLADIAALPIARLAKKDCHLFFWINGPLLVIGAHIPIMRAWGFEPVAMAFTWTKLNPREAGSMFLVKDKSWHVGPGYTTRHNPEFVVLGRRGNPRRLSKAIRELIIEPRREHSRKPEEFFDRCVRYADGPYLELFSRQSREGWDNWGNEANKFDAGPLQRKRVIRPKRKIITSTADLFEEESA
jgi:N6-adenosine-specific RNA methylase IME4